MQTLKDLPYTRLREVPIGTVFEGDGCEYTVIEHCSRIEKTVVQKYEKGIGYSYKLWHNIAIGSES
jgi:hypothetical protein